MGQQAVALQADRMRKRQQQQQQQQVGCKAGSKKTTKFEDGGREGEENEEAGRQQQEGGGEKEEEEEEGEEEEEERFETSTVVSASAYTPPFFLRLRRARPDEDVTADAEPSAEAASTSASPCKDEWLAGACEPCSPLAGVVGCYETSVTAPQPGLYVLEVCSCGRSLLGGMDVRVFIRVYVAAPPPPSTSQVLALAEEESSGGVGAAVGGKIIAGGVKGGGLSSAHGLRLLPLAAGPFRVAVLQPDVLAYHLT